MTPENWPSPTAYVSQAGGLALFRRPRDEPVYTATQVREIVRMEVEASVAFILFLHTWETSSEEVQDFSHQFISGLSNKWETEWLPAVEQDHSGDCTRQPWTCLRCSIDELLATAKRMMDPELAKRLAERFKTD